MATTGNGQSSPNIENHHYHYHNHHRTRVANLTKLIGVELDLLKESFEEAKRRIDPVIAQINQARHKFDLLLQQVGVGETMDTERELRDLKQTTGKLKSKIPFNLIAPEYQPSADPNVIFQPRTHPREPTSSSKPPVVVVDDYDASLWAGKSQDLNCFIDRLNKYPYAHESIISRCFLAFPEGAFIKPCLLCSYVDGVSSFFTSWDIVVMKACKLVSEGFIKSKYKKHSSTSVDGFWMDPFLHRTLKDRLPRKMQLECLVNITNKNGEDFIYSGSADVSTLPSKLRFLHLGKWQKSPSHPNIEMPDPNLYFKYAGDMQDLKYISFCGVSVMKELPNFVTQLRLKLLDLKACHHLEVLPSNIGDLWDYLTHLDMSECYFLDHMPASLSRLTRLRVLKGFYIGETDNEESCSLRDLRFLRDLVKLHIYTSLKTFPSGNHLTTIERFENLRNLTICWGGCPTREENPELRPPVKSPSISRIRLVTGGTHQLDRVNMQFLFHLEKLDLRGAPEAGTRDWLKPSNFEKLEKLYIRGGQLRHLTHSDEAQKDKYIPVVKDKGWSVKILRLRHLSKLQMDWSEVHDSFPNVVILEKEECPNLTTFPCDGNGLWTKDTTQPPADGSGRYGISSCERGPIECEDSVVEILEETAV